MLILALDLSLNCTGYSVLKYEDNRITIVEKGIISNKKIPTKLVGKKLLQIEEVLTDLFSRYLFQVIVLCNDNVKIEGKVKYLPIYMILFIYKEQVKNITFNLDLSGLN